MDAVGKRTCRPRTLWPATVVALLALAAFSGAVGGIWTTHVGGTRASVGATSLSPLLMPGDYVTLNCTGGYIDLDNSSACYNTVVTNYAWGSGTTNYYVTAGCVGTCTNPSSGVWGWHSTGVCIGATSSVCATYWTLPNPVSSINMWTYCASGQRCAGTLNLWSQAPSTYTVTFSANGLLTGIQWGVSFLSFDTNTTSGTISFQVPNGTWGFTSLVPDGYTASPASGFVAVNGAPQNEPITFTGIGLVSGSVSFSSGAPVDVAYDNLSGMILVTLTNPGALAIVNPGTLAVTSITSLGTGYTPACIVFDWLNNEAYVATTTSTGYYTEVFNASSGAFVKAITLSKAPACLAFDSAKNEIFVTMPNSGIGVIKASTNTLTKTISFTKVQTGIVYFPKAGEILVSDSSSEVSVISDSSLKVTKNLTLPGCSTPDGMAYDGSVSEVFVTCFGTSGEVVVLNATLVQVATVSLGQSDPTSAVYAVGCVWVTDDESSGAVSVIADSTGSANKVVNTISVGSSPLGEAYDSSIGDLFVANSASATLSEIST